MSENFERAKARLKNLNSIEPLLSALRTLSMSSWQMAQKKLQQIEAYEQNYNQILIEILPRIKLPSDRTKNKKDQQDLLTNSIVLLIGSERGLCGRFNENLIENSLQWIKSKELGSVQIWAMGSRMMKSLERMGVDFSWRKPLLASSLSTYQQAYELTQNWLEQFEDYQFFDFYIHFNQLKYAGRYKFSSLQLLPYQIKHRISEFKELETAWPPPIIETDPYGIYHKIIQHYLASSFLKVLLKSAASEHNARYNLMEEAQQNTEEIIEELSQVINTERKRKITQAMQELAVGAGLLDKE